MTGGVAWPASALLLVSGPTAVGKSEIALALAQELQAEILTIDSVQLYRGLDIGSAKPTHAEQKLVPHHLLDICEPTSQNTVADFLVAAERALGEIRARGRLPIFVGGTGLYVTALLQGLAELPAADPALRAALELRPTGDLWQELKVLDPESAARLHENDRIRIIRALETMMLGGRKASSVRQQHGHNTQVHPAVCLVPILDRDALQERINQRAKLMLERGLLREVQGLVDACGVEAPALEAIGYKECVATLRGEAPEEGLADRIALSTRQFAKRQLTFWRNEPRKRGWGVRPRGGEAQVLVGGTTQFRRAAIKPIPALPWSRSTLTAEVRARLLQPIENSEVWFVDAASALAS